MDRRKFLNIISTGVGSLLLAQNAKAEQIIQLFKTPGFVLKRADFGPDFIWGTATAAYQIEGGHNADGKGPSIWDKFSHKKGKIHENENGDIACDFYHLYEKDILLMKQMNIPAFRFSLSWSRIFPKGVGEINKAGVEFYHKVIDCCLKNGVEPWVTLYHWDLPQILEDQGGWLNRKVVDWFHEFSEFCTKEYGAKVKKWMVLNEPMAFTAVGYLAGIHAPGKIGFGKFLKASVHASLCLADGSKIIRKNVPNAEIGSTFS